MRERVGERDVALHRSRRQPRRRPRALHVENHARNFRKVSVTGIFGHERNARTGGRGHRARARPPRAEHDARRGQLVFRLDDRDVALAGFFIDAVAIAVLNEVLAERRRRRDRIPRRNGTAAHHAAEGRRAIPLHKHQTFGLAGHRHQMPRIVLLQMLGGVFDADADRRHIELDRRRFAAKLRAEALLDDLERYIEQARQHAHVDHVHQVLAQVAFVGEVLLRQGRERNGIVREIFAQRVAFARKRLFVHDGTARLDARDVLLPRRRIERDEHVELGRPALIAQRRDAHVEPCRQAFDVRRKDVLGSDGYAEARDGVGQDEVRGLTSRAVDRRHANREVVNGTRGHGRDAIRPWEWRTFADREGQDRC